MIRLERHGAVAHLVIDRAAKRNAITQVMWERFPALIGEAMANDATRVLLLRVAAPGAFSAGADIAEFATAARDPDCAGATKR